MIKMQFCVVGDSEAESEHCHEDSEARDLRDGRKRKKAMKKLIIATILCFLFMCGEIIGKAAYAVF